MSMTLQASDLVLYTIAFLNLFLTPRPVWVALLARAISGGFQAAWPLALGVALGDAIWPTLAILCFVAAMVFLVMGMLLILKAENALGNDRRLPRLGM